MCEVQILRKFNNKKNKLTKDDVRAFFKMLELGSYSNRDSYGFFTKNSMVRKPIAFYEENENAIGAFTTNILKSNSPFIIGHNRWTTQGDEKKIFNNHPFPTKDWLVVHNGVLTNDNELSKKYSLDYKEETDSAIVVHMLQKYYDEGNDPVVCIKKVAEQLCGRFSICAYNKTEDRLFYFKEKATSFAFRLYQFDDGSEVFVGSTTEDNFEHIYVDEYMVFYKGAYKSYMEVEPNENDIYEITDKKICVVDSFEPAKEPSYVGTRYNASGEKKKSWAINGGVYNNNWDDNEWQKSDYKDVVSASDVGNFVPVEHMDFRKDIEEYTQNLVEEYGETIGVDFDYDFDWKNAKAIISTNKSPLTENELRDTLYHQTGIRCKESSYSNNGTICLAIDFDELVEVYK